MLIILIKKGSLLTMKRVALIVHLYDYSNEFHYMMVNKENSFPLYFNDRMYF